MLNLPATYSRYLRLSLVALALSTVAFLSYQAAVLWYQGSAYSSLYSQRPLPKVKVAPLHKGESYQKVPCVDVQAIVRKTSATNKGQSPQTLALVEAQPIAASESAYLLQGVGDVPLVPRYPLLLGRYTVKAPVLTDLLLEARLDSEGILSVTPAPQQEQPRASLFEMGRIRDVGLWLGYSAAQSQAGLPTTRGYSIDLSWQQDLLRVGPVWSRLRVEGGWSEALGTNGKIQLGLPVVRF